MTERLRKALAECETVIIGAGAGLSTSAGYTYSGERFTKHFADSRVRGNSSKGSVTY